MGNGPPLKILGNAVIDRSYLPTRKPVRVEGPS
jgi:hypothetical protein